MTPLIFESGAHGERAYDVFSKLMTQRVIFIGQEIDDTISNIVCAQLNFLESLSEDPIHMYINSPGGVVTDTLAIYDTMQYISAPIHTLCIGRACSGAALLLLAGAKGFRRSLPHSEIMLHQPAGGVVGKVTDIERHASHIVKQKAMLNSIVAKHTGMDIAEASKLLEWDWFMSAEEARERGIIDSVIVKKQRSWT